MKPKQSIPTNVARYSGAKHTWFPAGETVVKAVDYDELVGTNAELMRQDGHARKELNAANRRICELETHAEDVEKSNLQLGAQIRALKAVLLEVRHTTMQTRIDCALRLDEIYVITGAGLS